MKLNYLNLIQEILILIAFALSAIFLSNLDSESMVVVEYTMLIVVAINILLSYIYAIFYGIINIYEICCKKKQMTIKVVDDPSPIKENSLQIGNYPEESIVSRFSSGRFREECIFMEPKLFVSPAMSKRPSYANLFEIEELK